MFIPSLYEEEFKRILAPENYTKYQDAFKGSAKDLERNLPAEIDDSAVQDLIAYINQMEKTQIIDVLE